MRLSTAQYTFNSIYETGRRGLTAQQTNMNVIGNNISNIHTEGYTRQRVEQEAGTPLQAAHLNFESGVIADTVRRMRDTYYDIQVRNESPLLSMYQEEYHQLSLIEGMLGEPGQSGINFQLDQFFKSWEQLANDPEATTTRTVVRDAGISLANSFNRIDNNLKQHQEQMDQNLIDSTKEANYHIREISELTYKIMVAEKNSSEISTLMDRRDLALDKLSKLMDITYSEKDDGNLYVFCNGIIVNQGKDYNQIMTKENETNSNLSTIYWLNEGIDVTLNSGKMKGILNIRDQIIPDMINNLDDLVKNFVTEVNKLHTANYDIEGSNGNHFFDPNGLTMKDMILDNNILRDVKFISASTSAGHLGNGDGALALSELGDSGYMNQGKESFREYYNKIVISHGTYTRETERLVEMQKTFVNQLENKRSEASEVDLDEELSAMIRYQQAYGACSKIITKTEQMISSLLAMV